MQVLSYSGSWALDIDRKFMTPCVRIPRRQGRSRREGPHLRPGPACSRPARVGGEHRSGHTTHHGDVWLADAHPEAAWAAIRTNDTYLQANFWKVAEPRADSHRKNKHGSVAVAHKIHIPAYHIMVATPGEVYRDHGADYVARHHKLEPRREITLSPNSPSSSTTSA